jgi:hypothetical protein
MNSCYNIDAETHISGRFLLSLLRFGNNNLAIVGKAPSVIGIRPAVCLSNRSNNNRRRFAMKGLDLSQKIFGKLVALRITARGGTNNHNKWLCVCECGDEVTVESRRLINGEVKSCKKCAEHGNKTHGKTNSRIYYAWASMLQRCENPNKREWNYYGGRGIKVCERWHSFEFFMSDMGEPGPELTLDRIDNDGDYEPQNCRWVTIADQNRNRRPYSEWNIKRG